MNLNADKSARALVAFSLFQKAKLTTSRKPGSLFPVAAEVSDDYHQLTEELLRLLVDPSVEGASMDALIYSFEDAIEDTLEKREADELGGDLNAFPPITRDDVVATIGFILTVNADSISDTVTMNDVYAAIDVLVEKETLTGVDMISCVLESL